jgi:hypothetical protein
MHAEGFVPEFLVESRENLSARAHETRSRVLKQQLNIPIEKVKATASGCRLSCTRSEPLGLGETR